MPWPRSPIKTRWLSRRISRPPPRGKGCDRNNKGVIMIGAEQKPRATRVTSPAMQAQADKARKYSVLAVKGISRGKLVHIDPEDFKKLDVDPTYQRGETNFVSSI